jgi:hypothetical protein
LSRPTATVKPESAGGAAKGEPTLGIPSTLAALASGAVLEDAVQALATADPVEAVSPTMENTICER